MGDRVAVLKDGILQQCASPRELYTAPVNIFVAGFIGSPAMNLFPAAVTDEGATAGSFTLPMTAEQRSAITSDQVTIGVRPGDLSPSTEGGIEATVHVVEELGSEAFLYCTAEHTDREIVARVDGLSGARIGDAVSLVPDFKGVHLFDTASGARL